MTGVAPQTDGVERGSWGRAADFFITMLGFAVGLGNVWRFPNVVYSYGGGAFFIPYVLAIVLIGYPLFLLETSIGQYSRKNAIQVWDISPVFKGIGMAGISVIMMINVYYTTPISWGLFYMVMSMTDKLPWAECHPDWATPNCTNETAAEEFFYRRTVNISPSITDWGEFNWELFLCNLAVWIIVFAAVCYGAASLGKVAYFTSLFPYVMLTVMFIYTLTLEGSDEGIYYYIRPDMSKLQDIRVWSVAVAQVFFSTGLGTGVVPQMSSYNKFDHNVLRDSVLVPSCDALTSFYAGFSVFSILGYMAKIQDKDVAKVVTAGPGLIFITYPETFLTLDGGQVLSVFFFFMVIILGLSSTIPSVECVCSVISDYTPWFRKTRLRNILLRFIVCMSHFLCGIFFYFGNGFFSYSMIDDRVIGYSLMIIGLFETIALAYFIGPIRMLTYVEEMIGGWHRFRFFRYFFMISWVLICPASVLFIFIFDIANQGPYIILEGYLDYLFPDWALAIGWGLVSISGFLIVLIATLTLIIGYDCLNIFYRSTQPNKKWKRRDDADISTPKDIEIEVVSPQRQQPSAPLPSTLPPPPGYSAEQVRMSYQKANTTNLGLTYQQTTF